MAWDIDPSEYDDDVISGEGKPIGIPRFGLTFFQAPTLRHRVLDRDQQVNKPGSQPQAGQEDFESAVRRRLAVMGFKPDANFAQDMTLRFSRVQDLQAVTDVGDHTLDPRIQSHVVPYVFATYEGPVTVNLPDEIGLLLPYPWPRVLNAFRIYRPANGWSYFPTNIVSDGEEIPRYALIEEDGTMEWPRSGNLAIMPSDGVIELPAGTYELQIGWAHPNNGGTSSFGPTVIDPPGDQRWPSS